MISIKLLWKFLTKRITIRQKFQKEKPVTEYYSLFKLHAAGIFTETSCRCFCTNIFIQIQLVKDVMSLVSEAFQTCFQKHVTKILENLPFRITVNDSYFTGCTVFYFSKEDFNKTDLTLKFSAERRRLELFCKKSVLKTLAKFTRKHLCWCLILITLQA